MPNQSYIEAHELMAAYNAVLLSGAGLSDLATLAEYDIDPLEDDAEARIIEIIEDQATSEFASNAYKLGRAA